MPGKASGQLSCRLIFRGKWSVQEWGQMLAELEDRGWTWRLAALGPSRAPALVNVTLVSWVCDTHL